jgi:putative ABC transport system substrate-binding protein
VELGNPPYDLARAFAVAVLGRAEALLVLAFPVTSDERARICDLALQHRLPLMASFRGWANAGALMNYEPNHADMFRRVAYYVDRILQGTKPADLPMEQPVKFDLSINLKTAKALGITIPPSLLIQGDEVIR